jgi:hypothetical protein
VPQAVTQGEWTEECNTALAALISLKIPKRTAVELVRRASGTTHQEILRAALQIHGQARAQVNGYPIGPGTNQGDFLPASDTIDKQKAAADAIAALVSLGIPSETATALVQKSSGNSTQELVREALKALRKTGPA